MISAAQNKELFEKHHDSAKTKPPDDSQHIQGSIR